MAESEKDVRLRTLRIARGWSQGELAERAGISRTGVSAIEGRRLDPSVTTALALARALEVSVEELFGEPAVSPTIEWAWPPRGGSTRYWHAEVRGRSLAYPAEPTACGEIAHDGVARGAAPPTPTERDARETLIVAGCDPAAALLATEYAQRSRFRMIPLLRSSRQALELLKRGLVHVAGIHLSPSDQANGNSEVVRRTLGPGMRLLRLAEWEEGVAMAPGRQHRSVRSLLKSEVRWVGREPGSGARRCLDELLGENRVVRRIAGDHRGVAEAVRHGWGDAGICLRLTSDEAGLEFLSLQWESYDLCFPADLEDDPRLKNLVGAIRETRFQRAVAELPGYDVRNAGTVVSV